MSKTHIVDPQNILRIVDTETNKNVDPSYGREDMDKSDYLQITGNGTTREIVIEGKNDNETDDHVPLRLVGERSTVVTKTADYTVTVADSGKTFSTAGAGATVVFALPAAVAGLKYRFYVGAAQELRIDPNLTETISLPSTGVAGAAGKYLTANAAGETVDIECVVAGTWSVFGFTGTWTAEG